MIYLLCSIMVNLPDGTRHTKDLHGYGIKFGSGYIVNLQRDADMNGYTSTGSLTSYASFPGECHEE